MISRNNFLILFLLGGWSLFHYRLGNRFYAIAIVLLFIILSVHRLRNFTIIMSSVLVIILFKMPVPETIAAIKDLNLDSLQSTKLSLNTIFTPNSGLEVLPEPVKNILRLINTHSISDYRTPPSLISDEYIRQRLIESSWPAKMEPVSQNVFLVIEEVDNYPDCSEIDREGNIVLIHCP